MHQQITIFINPHDSNLSSQNHSANDSIKIMKNIYYFHKENEEVTGYAKPNLTIYLKHLTHIPSIVSRANLFEQYLKFSYGVGATPFVTPFDASCLLKDYDSNSDFDRD